MKAQYSFRLLMISLCISCSVAQGAGIAVPTMAAVLVKAVGSISAYGAADFVESVIEGKQLKTSSNTDLYKSSLSKNTPLTQIKEAEQSIFPLIITAAAFLSIIAWNIKMSKQAQGQVPTDKQAIEVEKA